MLFPSKLNFFSTWYQYFYVLYTVSVRQSNTWATFTRGNIALYFTDPFQTYNLLRFEHAAWASDSSWLCVYMFYLIHWKVPIVCLPVRFSHFRHSIHFPYCTMYEAHRGTSSHTHTLSHSRLSSLLLLCCYYNI